MYKLACFYHVARMGNWIDVDNEIMDRIKGCGLYSELSVFNRLESSDIEKYEFPTLELLREFCWNNPDYFVLYLHTKGVSRPNSESIADWRRCMLYFLVDRYAHCVKRLNSYDAVSINYMPGPMPHFQGNFWWAKAEYINTLGCIRDVPDLPDDDRQFGVRHKCEMWVLSNPDVRWYQFYHHRINPYIKTNPFNNYAK